MRIFIFVLIFFISSSHGRIDEDMFDITPPLYHGEDIMDGVDFSKIIESEYLMKGIGGLTDLGNGDALVQLVNPAYHFMDDFKDIKDDFLNSNALDGYHGVSPHAHVVFNGHNRGYRPFGQPFKGKFPIGFNEFNLKFPEFGKYKLPQHNIHFKGPKHLKGGYGGHGYHPKPLGVKEHGFYPYPPSLGGIPGPPYHHPKHVAGGLPYHPPKPLGGIKGPKLIRPLKGGIRIPKFLLKPLEFLKRPRLPLFKRPFGLRRPLIGKPAFKGPHHGMKPPSVEIPGIGGLMPIGHKTDIKKAYLKTIKLDEPVPPSILKYHPSIPYPAIRGKIPSSFNPFSSPFTGLESFSIPIQNNFNLLTKNLKGLPLPPPKTDITKAHLKNVKLNQPYPPKDFPLIPDVIVSPEVVAPEGIITPEEVILAELENPDLIPAIDIPDDGKPYISVNFSKEDELDYTLVRGPGGAQKRSIIQPKPVDQTISFSNKGSIISEVPGGLVQEEIYFGDKLISITE